MKAIAAAIVSVSFLLAAPAVAQEADLTVDQIVQKHTEALGGAAKLKAIQSFKATGKASLMGGQIEAPVVLQIKRPNSMRMDMDIQGKSLVQAFDGTTAWMINPFVGSTDPQKSSEEDTKSMRDEADMIEGNLIDYKAKGNTVELIGKEDVEGSPAYKLKVTKKSGNIEYQYLDAQTFLQIKNTGKRKQMGQEFDSETIPGNYKPVNGVMMPFSISQKMNGNPVLQITMDKIEANVPVDEALFKFPEKPKEEKPKEETKPPEKP